MRKERTETIPIITTTEKCQSCREKDLTISQLSETFQNQSEVLGELVKKHDKQCVRVRYNPDKSCDAWIF